MRSKTTPIWEQHLEKGILALLVVVLLVILFIGLTGSPNQVEVRVRGQARTLSPGELNELILSEANSIRMRQTPDASPMEQPPAVRELRMLSPDVTEVIEGEVLPNDALARTAPMVAGGLVSPGSAEDLLYHLPAPPPVRVVGVEQFLDEFTAGAAEENPGLLQLTDGGSREIDWVTPVIEIDMAATRNEFNGGTEREPAPPAFWRDSTYSIVDVQFERQMMGPDGTWSADSQLVPVFLDTLNFRDSLGSYADALKVSVDSGAPLDAAQEQFRNEVIPPLGQPILQTELLQPTFVQTRFGAADEFLRNPEGLSSRGDKSLEVLDLEMRINREQRRAARVQSELAALGGPLEDPQDTSAGDGRDGGRGGGGRGGRGGRGGGGGGSGGSGGSGGGGGYGSGFGGGLSGGGGRSIGGGATMEAEELERNNALRISKTRLLKRVQAKIDELLEKLRGLDPENSLLAPDDEFGEAAGGLVNLNEDDFVLAWTHDPAVDPGATYRYRAIVSFYNPFFTRGFQLDPSQERLSTLPTLETSTSSWSSPIKVDSGTEFLLTEATPPSGTQLGSATIKVFSRQGGRYWSRSYTVGPGDRIGGIQSTKSSDDPIDFGTDWYVLDIISDGSSQESGGGVQVFLQRIGGDERLMIRSPALDAANPVFKAMELKVQNADAREQVAASSETP